MDRIFIEVRANPSDPDDAALVDLVDSLKGRGELSDTVRAAIPLFVDLQAGRLDVLFLYFPHLRARFVQDTVQDIPRYDDQFVNALVDAAVEALQPLFRPQYILYAGEAE